MKKKSKVLVAFTLLIFCLSSCVYSLFPIYTKETIVFFPELIGKWQMGDNPSEYIMFESTNKDDNITISEGEEEYMDSISGEGWKIRTGDTISVEIDGKRVTDRDSVKIYYDSIFGKLKSPNSSSKSLAEKVQESTDQFSGKVSEVQGDSYKMTVMDDGHPLVYEVHMVKIGGDFFLDLYTEGDSTPDNIMESMVWFPVHTFMKVKLEGDQLYLTQFDLNKLNKLFKSNLVRLRHENVEGTILLTAQPKELQKFLDKYSDDKSVFENSEVYARVQ